MPLPCSFAFTTENKLFNISLEHEIGIEDSKIFDNKTQISQNPWLINIHLLVFINYAKWFYNSNF